MGTIDPTDSLSHQKGPAVLPSYYDQKPLIDHLEHRENLPPDFEAGRLTAERVAHIGVLAAAASGGYAATGHLLALVAALPVPEAEGEETGDRNEFWFRFWQASGSACLLPVNVKRHIPRALGGEGAGLAQQLLSAFGEMTSRQRAATALLVGEHLTDGGEFPGPPQAMGELWLRDVELTAWRVLHADRIPFSREAQKAFREAWSRV